MYVFVYGSLKKGFYNESLLQKASYIGESITCEKYSLYKTNLDPYPFLLEENNNETTNITGEIYKIDENILKILDRLEGYPNFYDRKIIEVISENTSYSAIAYFLKNKATLENRTKTLINKWLLEDELERNGG
jgi:gamma-glutamylaminecyclotransferase